MNTVMNEYTIFCTEEQTKKALELGAPIINYPLISSPYGIPKFEEKGIAYILPTAEQMIGWLEGEGFRINRIYNFDLLTCTVVYKNHCISDVEIYDIPKKATLAAIDAALDYII